MALRLGVACILAVFCAGLASLMARAQSDATTSGSSSAKKTSSTKAANAKTHANAPATTSKASSTAKTHSASHTTTTNHPKSTTASSARSSKSTHASSKRSSKRRTARGQQKIEPERAEAIQEALIREHYLSGEPRGNLESTQRRSHAPLPGGSRLADQNRARFPGSHQAWGSDPATIIC